MKQGKIIIDGEIVPNYSPKGVSLLDVISQVESQKDCDELVVFINSIGGSVYAGVNIIMYLIDTGKKIITVGGDIVASIATVIFMAGDERYISDSTEFMIHLPYINGGDGYAMTADDLRAMEKELRGIENFLINFYSTRTGLTDEIIKALLDEETWLRPEHVVSLGIASLLEKTPVVARANVSNKQYFM